MLFPTFLPLFMSIIHLINGGMLCVRCSCSFDEITCRGLNLRILNHLPRPLQRFRHMDLRGCYISNGFTFNFIKNFPNVEQVDLRRVSDICGIMIPDIRDVIITTDCKQHTATRIGPTARVDKHEKAPNPTLDGVGFSNRRELSTAGINTLQSDYTSGTTFTVPLTAPTTAYKATSKQGNTFTLTQFGHNKQTIPFSSHAARITADSDRHVTSHLPGAASSTSDVALITPLPPSTTITSAVDVSAEAPITRNSDKTSLSVEASHHFTNQGKIATTPMIEINPSRIKKGDTVKIVGVSVATALIVLTILGVLYVLYLRCYGNSQTNNSELNERQQYFPMHSLPRTSTPEIAHRDIQPSSSRTPSTIYSR